MKNKRLISMVFRSMAEEEISVSKRYIFDDNDINAIHISEEQKQELKDIAIWFIMNRDYRFEMYRNSPTD